MKVRLGEALNIAATVLVRDSFVIESITLMVVFAFHIALKVAKSRKQSSTQPAVPRLFHKI
jgi:hypothetical protein